MSLTKPHVPICGPLIAGLGCVTRVADICFLVLINLLALEVRPVESFVMATVLIWDFMLGVFYQRVLFSPCTVSYAYLCMIQGQLYPLMGG